MQLIGKIEEVWFGGYGLVPFKPFAWAQHMHATTGSTSGSWRRSCTQNFRPKTAFILWLIVSQSFYPNTFLRLKHSYLSLANSNY